MNFIQNKFNKDLISIIIPIYNTERFLRHCLDSVREQTYTNFEAILVDDGSTDGSADICDEYCNQDERFKVFHRENHGVGQSRNFALDQARGEYIAFLDSDDSYHPQFLEILHETVRDTGQLVAMCAYHEIKETHTIKPAPVPDPSAINVQIISQHDAMAYITGSKKSSVKLKTPLVVSFHVITNKLYHSSLFDLRRFTRNMAEDTEMNISVYLEIPTLAYVPLELYFMTQRAGSLTRSSKNRVMIFVIKEYFDSYRRLLQCKYPLYEKWFIGNYYNRFLSRRALVMGSPDEQATVEYFGKLVKEFYPDFKRLIPWYRRWTWNFLWRQPQLCHLIIVKFPHVFLPLVWRLKRLNSA